MSIDPKIRAALQEMDRSMYGDAELPYRMRDLLGWPYSQTPMNAAYEYIYPPTPDEIVTEPHEHEFEDRCWCGVSWTDANS